MKVLYVQASPRGERSHSTHVAEAFLDEFKAKNPEGEIIVRNVFDMALPEFDGELITGKYNIMRGQEHSADVANAWASVEQLIEEFKSADKYVFSVPMWNFSIPYKLKHYIDIVSQPGYTFGFGDNGYVGLVEGPAFIAYARGGTYPEGTEAAAINYQSTYLEFQLGFLGLGEIASVATEQTLSENRDEIKAEAVKKAKGIAADF